MYDDLHIDVSESCIMVDLWQMGTISSWKIENTYYFCDHVASLKNAVTTATKSWQWLQLSVWQYRGAILAILDNVIRVLNDRRVIACLCLLTPVLKSKVKPCTMFGWKQARPHGRLAQIITDQMIYGTERTCGIVVQLKDGAYLNKHGLMNHSIFSAHGLSPLFTMYD